MGGFCGWRGTLEFSIFKAVGGIYMPNLTKDISTLAIFIVVFVIFTVFFKKPINKVTEKIQDRFNESDLTGH